MNISKTEKIIQRDGEEEVFFTNFLSESVLAFLHLCIVCLDTLYIICIMYMYTIIRTSTMLLRQIYHLFLFIIYFCVSILIIWFSE